MTGQPSEAKPSLSTTNGNLTEDGFNTVPAVEGTDVKLTCKVSSPTNNFTHSVSIISHYKVASRAPHAM